jgi:hypothetical protein
MARTIISLKLFTGLAVATLASITVACTDGSTVAANPPLPSDRSYSPAGPNCYPDINHCASYPTGGVSPSNPTEPPVHR